jgi:phosphoglycolate phosphatase
VYDTCRSLARIWNNPALRQKSRNMWREALWVRLIVFDWDGTLMDSIEQIVVAMQTCAQELAGGSLDDSSIRDSIGLGLTEAVQLLFPDMNKDFVRRFTHCYRCRYTNIPTEKQHTFPGIKNLLQELHEEGFLLAVATGKGRSGLDRVLESTQLRHFFHSSRCADETLSKPNPKMLLELMNELAVEPKQMLMVGDSAIDMEMANNAGTACVAVTYGVHNAAKLCLYQPCAMAHSVAHLRQHLLRYSGKSDFGSDYCESDNSME